MTCGLHKDECSKSQQPQRNEQTYVVNDRLVRAKSYEEARRISQPPTATDDKPLSGGERREDNSTEATNHRRDEGQVSPPSQAAPRGEQWTPEMVKAWAGDERGLAKAINAALAAEREQVKRIADFAGAVTNKAKDLQSQLNDTNEKLRLYSIRIVEGAKQLAAEREKLKRAQDFSYLCHQQLLREQAAITEHNRKVEHWKETTTCSACQEFRESLAISEACIEVMTTEYTAHEETQKQLLACQAAIAEIYHCLNRTDMPHDAKLVRIGKLLLLDAAALDKHDAEVRNPLVDLLRETRELIPATWPSTQRSSLAKRIDDALVKEKP
jgi:hypothetical protein